jgi:hypothetical protein
MAPSKKNPDTLISPGLRIHRKNTQTLKHTDIHKKQDTNLKIQKDTKHNKQHPLPHQVRFQQALHQEQTQDTSFTSSPKPSQKDPFSSPYHNPSPPHTHTPRKRRSTLHTPYTHMPNKTGMKILDKIEKIHKQTGVRILMTTHQSNKIKHTGSELDPDSADIPIPWFNEELATTRIRKENQKNRVVAKTQTH